MTRKYKFSDNKIITDLRKLFNKYDPLGVYYGEDVNFDEYDHEILKTLWLFQDKIDFKEFSIRFPNIFSYRSNEEGEFSDLIKEVYDYLGLVNLDDIKKTVEELNQLK